MADVERLMRRTAFQGRVIDVTLERVRLPNGHVCDLEIVRHRGAAAVVPVDPDGRVLLVRQYRHATGGWILEVPAGKLDRGERPEECARREIVEETGHRAGRLEPLGWIWTTPGFTDEKIWLFLASELKPGTQALQHDEVLTVERVPLTKAIDMAIEGEIVDAKSICAILRAGRHLCGTDRQKT
jgi:ADP-ribose pyrophosphatase